MGFIRMNKDEELSMFTLSIVILNDISVPCAMTYKCVHIRICSKILCAATRICDPVITMEMVPLVQLIIHDFQPDILFL